MIGLEVRQSLGTGDGHMRRVFQHVAKTDNGLLDLFCKIAIFR